MTDRAKVSADLKYRYGITLDEYEARLAAQRGVCYICHGKPGRIRLSVDHDHACCPGRRSCGKCLRKLLCKSCNYKLLGQVCKESVKGKEHAIAVLRRAIEYLEREPETVNSEGTDALRRRRAPVT